MSNSIIQSGMRNFEKRRQIIVDFYRQWRKQWLADHPGQREPRVYNYSLKDYIYVTKLSRNETAFHSVYTLTTMRMIKNHFNEILRYAVAKDYIMPKNNSHQSGYYKLIIMERKIKNIGAAKLTVGVRKCDEKKEQYCITSI